MVKPQLAFQEESTPYSFNFRQVGLLVISQVSNLANDGDAAELRMATGAP